jgi:bifunctional oligoribonuclease and PAP phosphatase NrnA
MPDTPHNLGDPHYAAKCAQIATRLLAHTGPIVVVAHEDPDGDALGSVLGLTRALATLGRPAQAVADLPRYLRFLTSPEELHPPLAALPEAALLCILDCGDLYRVAGVPKEPLASWGAIINIDHHGTNSRFGEIALVSPDRPAACVMIKDVIDALQVASSQTLWDEHLATPVLTGIITDTGSFRYSSTTADTLHTAAELVGHGARLAWINEHLGIQPRSVFRLQALVLATIEYALDNQVVLAHVDESMLAESGATWEEVEALVSVIRAAEGTSLAMLFKDRGEQVKLSLRSRLPVSAQNVAVACGGGGHVPAAGASIALPLAEAKAKALAAAAVELRRVGLLAE